MDYRDYITIDPNKRGGKPCVRGLRITVYEVLEYLASDMTEDQILADFPDLTRDDLKACIAFAADRERNASLQVVSREVWEVCENLILCHIGSQIFQNLVDGDAQAADAGFAATLVRVDGDVIPIVHVLRL